MARLREGLENSRRALIDPIAFAESQTDFHYLVVTLAGNRTLALMARLLNEVIRLHETTVHTDPAHDPLRTAALKEHEDFVDLLETRREADAEAFWRAHLHTNAENLLGDSDLTPCSTCTAVCSPARSCGSASRTGTSTVLDLVPVGLLASLRGLFVNRG